MTESEDFRLKLAGEEVRSDEESTYRPRLTRKRKKMERTDPNRGDRFQRECDELIRELDDLEKAVKEDYLRRHWFTGVRILLNRPIHSV